MATKGRFQMMVLGADTHKRSHAIAAVNDLTGRVIADLTVRATRRAFEELLVWARGLDDRERVWAIEDCRHVSGALERFLLARGEAVVRVAPKLTAGARSSARELGKSSMPSRSPAPRCAKASTACPSRGWPDRSSRSGCLSITASG